MNAFVLIAIIYYSEGITPLPKTVFETLKQCKEAEDQIRKDLYLNINSKFVNFKSTCLPVNTAYNRGH